MQSNHLNGPQGKEFLSTREVAKQLGVSLPTVQGWVESGVLPAWKTAGGHRRIPAVAVESIRQKQQAVLDTVPSPGIFKVLLVEDEPVQRELYSACFTDWGLPLKLFTAEDGFDGLILAERHRPDLIIADLAMPGVDGFAMLRKLESSGYRGAIIAVTALDAGHIAARGGLPQGMPVFPKPIPFAALRTLIGQRVEKFVR